MSIRERLHTVRYNIANILIMYLDAVKVLDWGKDGQDTAAKHREAFQKEVAVWQKLDHPNITKVCMLNPPFSS